MAHLRLSSELNQTGTSCLSAQVLHTTIEGIHPLAGMANSHLIPLAILNPYMYHLHVVALWDWDHFLHWERLHLLISQVNTFWKPVQSLMICLPFTQAKPFVLCMCTQRCRAGIFLCCCGVMCEYYNYVHLSHLSLESTSYDWRETRCTTKPNMALF